MRTETSDITELPDVHLMGHTCANLNGELFFVWGGSNENVNYLPIQNEDLWIYETLTGYWRHRKCSGECPPYLSSTTSTLIGRKMYIFGGHSTRQDNWLNCLYCLDLETFVWKDLGSHAEAEPTKPIRSDKCTSWSYQGKFYVFGGYGWSQTEHMLQLLDKQKDLQLIPDYRWPKFGWNNQLVEYDPRTSNWRWPSYKGNCPSARAAHSGALMGSNYYIFGGRDCNERLNDLYMLNMETMEWTQIAVFTDVDSSSAIQRPINHLGAAISEEDSEDGDDREEDQMNEDIEEVNQVLDQTESGDDEPIIIEHLTPSPSSSCNHRLTKNAMTSASANNYALRTSNGLGDTSSSSSDSDDDEMNFEYPHPSHLLEQWSLTSHQSASHSSALDQNINCYRNRPQGNCVYNSNDLNNLSIMQQSVNQIESESNNLAEQNNDHSNAQDGGQINLQVNDHGAAEVIPVVENQTESEAEPQFPIGRSFSSFTPISENQILLYGGVSSQDKSLSDCWIFDIDSHKWTRLDIKYKKSRLWHTGARTKNNEVVVIGGSSSGKMDEFCTEVLTISLGPKSLKRLALDSVARSIRMRLVSKSRGLPPTVCKLVRLRKQAIALSSRRS